MPFRELKLRLRVVPLFDYDKSKTTNAGYLSRKEGCGEGQIGIYNSKKFSFQYISVHFQMLLAGTEHWYEWF